MAYTVDLPTYTDGRGKLTVAERIPGLEFKRAYWIYEATGERGGHRHQKAVQGLLCIKGSCWVTVKRDGEETKYPLDKPARMLVLEPEDWHTMDEFSDDCILIVFASEYYSRADYIYTPFEAAKAAKKYIVDKL
jgi:quercetin dioxygenase-like cupin family protein